MGHIQIAAVDHRLFLIQLHQVGAQIVLPLHPIVDAGQPLLGVGGVDVHQIKLRVFQRDGPALVAVLLRPDAVAHAQRRLLAVAGGAGIALFLGTVKILGVALRLKFRLPGLALGLLQAEDVRIQRGKTLGKALFQHRPQAVHVPADEFHRKPSKTVTFPDYTGFSCSVQGVRFRQTD